MEGSSQNNPRLTGFTPSLLKASMYDNVDTEIQHSTYESYYMYQASIY